MNSLKNYFSPTKLESPSTQTLSEPATPSTPKLATTPSTKNGPTPKPSPKTQSRQIISNMESVISSVKKKHRHRRRKETNGLNKSEPEITDISNILSNSLSFVSPNTTQEKVKGSTPDLKENVASNGVVEVVRRRSKEKRLTNSGKRRKNSLKSATVSSSQKSGLDEDDAKLISTQESSVDTNTPTQSSAKDTSSEVTIVDDDPKPLEENTTPKINAFTFMMSARNRTIGSNQAGKDPSQDDLTSPSNPEKVKRKLMLQDWADRKGGRKRKLEELQREEYVEHQMEQRAKRLKKMLVNSPKSVKKTSKRLKSAAASTEAISASSSQETLNEEPRSETKNTRTRRKPRGRQNEITAPPDSSVPTDCSPIVNGKNLSALRKKRSRRISSAESDGSVVCSQESDFVQKLSSPIKKRDSLLGYFPKIVSPTNVKEEKEKDSPEPIECKQEVKTRKAGRKPKNSSKTVESKEIDPPASEAETPTSRPRRSCANRVHYDEEYFYGSPEKVEPRRQRSTNKTSEKNEDKGNDDVICLDISTENSSAQKPKKLAPLFIKNVPKPAIDPAIMQARKDFLMSGIPEKLKLEIAKQKQFEENYEISLESLFPKISHVGHESDEERVASNRSIDWEKCGVSWHEKTNSPDRLSKVHKVNGLKPFTPLKKPLPTLGTLDEVENKVDIIKTLKVSYEKFPTYRCYKQLRGKYKQTRKLAVQQVSDSVVMLKTNSKVNDDENGFSVNGEMMFTEKYKPMTSDQVLVNLQPVSQLKNFLSGWQNGRCSAFNDSSDDFEASNDSNYSGFCNCVVLCGPSSSGKTNAVFALANELNFNVLEINAGMKRNGKKLLQEMQEATQSHLVKSDKPNMLKRSLSGNKAKDLDGNDSSSISDLSGSAKLSLILVEDADIVFEQDSGFVEAVYQLVNTSKRPVIIISNSLECPHLTRLQKQSCIEFPKPNVLNISKFLSVMSLVENCFVELDDIMRLYLYNDRNVRRTLLEMQFFIQSGGDRVRVKPGKPSNLQSPRKFFKDDTESEIVDDVVPVDKTAALSVYSHQTLFDFFTINQNSDYLIQCPIDFECLHYNLDTIFENLQKPPEKPATRGRRSKNSAQHTSKAPESIDNIIQFYENASVASYLTSPEVESRLSENLEETIAHTLVEKSLRAHLHFKTKIDMAPRSKPERLSLSTYLPQSIVRSNRSIDLDYEPVLRSICRSEKARSQVERRGSRFYHYLRNICTSTNNFSTNEFDRTCSVLSVSTGSEENSVDVGSKDKSTE
ncbi:ATPase family AAA domain-containing protein 5 [Hermetia illucens]|nr:ATPase family AAA domain-containing protein 5 [Hermetia illucens]